MDTGIQPISSPGPSLAGLAQVEACAAASDRLETQHILLALLSRPSAAGRALSSHGVTRELIEAAVSRIVGTGVREERHEIDPKRAALCERSRALPPSLQAERAFFGAIDEAHRLRHDVVHWGHALLGLLRESGGIAVTALRAVGVDANAVRASVLSEMAGG